MNYEEMMERLRNTSLSELIRDFSNYIRWWHYNPGDDPDEAELNWMRFVGEHFEAEIQRRIQNGNS